MARRHRASAGSHRFGIDQMSDAVIDALEAYSGSVEEALDEKVREAGKTARKEVRARAPKRTGDYKKSWKVKNRVSKGEPRVTVYAGNGEHRLTHLLENGHAKRGGGRVAGIPHIGPAQEVAEEQLLRDLKQSLSE